MEKCPVAYSRSLSNLGCKKGHPEIDQARGFGCLVSNNTLQSKHFVSWYIQIHLQRYLKWQVWLLYNNLFMSRYYQVWNCFHSCSYSIQSKSSMFSFFNLPLCPKSCTMGVKPVSAAYHWTDAYHSSPSPRKKRRFITQLKEQGRLLNHVSTLSWKKVLLCWGL